MKNFKHEIFVKPGSTSNKPRLKIQSYGKIAEYAVYYSELQSFYPHNIKVGNLDSEANLTEEESLFGERSTFSDIKDPINAFLEIPIYGSNWSVFQGLSVPSEPGRFYIARLNLDKDNPKIDLYERNSERPPIISVGLEGVGVVGRLLAIQSRKPNEICSKLEEQLALTERTAKNKIKIVEKQPTNAFLHASDYFGIDGQHQNVLILTGFIEK